ncbi:hypothetical protein E2C01_029861 [Portunus trituberculatus]|uniref:Uncharacterized protein n=1 Tax=Portunus trituberculatus TaxID=210409 RepID=A0A5B7EVQ1_PORTR|nr:hypothetical protein [Portunus trituberculatus]
MCWWQEVLPYCGDAGESGGQFNLANQGVLTQHTNLASVVSVGQLERSRPSGGGEHDRGTRGEEDSTGDSYVGSADLSREGDKRKGSGEVEGVIEMRQSCNQEAIESFTMASLTVRSGRISGI